MPKQSENAGLWSANLGRYFLISDYVKGFSQQRAGGKKSPTGQKPETDTFSLLGYICRLTVLVVLFLASNQEAGAAYGPLPRYASLRSNKVNIHVGPGSDFPVEWRFQRQGMPIEIIAEFDTWRQIRDMEGTTGWVHKSLLVGKRNAIIMQGKQTASQSTAQSVPAIQQAANPQARVVAYLEPGVIAKIKQCKADWCRLEVKGYDGWIERKNIWGAYSHEEKF